jgi:hypothetical protein
MSPEVGKITEEMYEALLKKQSATERELELFKQKSPIVGLRWYGEGGFGIGLTYPIMGITKVSLEGYGTKAVIDHSSWLRVRNTEEVRAGILVRDDSVVAELGIIGVTADPEKVENTNAFTDGQIEELLSSTLPVLKKVVKKFTNHFPCRHFLKVAKRIKNDEKEKSFLLMERYRELFLVHLYGLLNVHDLRTACELRGFPFVNKDEDEMISMLVKEDIKQNVEVDFGL